jgi:hypothetical protein
MHLQPVNWCLYGTVPWLRLDNTSLAMPLASAGMHCMQGLRDTPGAFAALGLLRSVPSMRLALGTALCVWNHVVSFHFEQH